MKFQHATWKIAPSSGALNGSNEFPLRLKAFRWLGRQTWIPHGRDWMLRKIWNPDGGHSYQFEVDFFGFRYPGDLAQFIDWGVFAYGSYPYSELSLLDALTQELRKRLDRVTFLDIGANVGHHTLFMAGKADWIVAVEPFPALQQLIEQKIAINHLSHVQLLPFALGESEGVLEYYPGGGSNSGAGTFLPEEDGTYQEPVKIPIKRGDQLLAELGLQRIDICKVDVEGFEPLVFRGLADHLRADRPPILTEISDRSRAGFGNADAFKACFWEGAIYAEVEAKREGYPFQLRPFHYETAQEVLILPPEMADFASSHMVA
jgi:FkbM family methyltransferase